MAFLKKRDSGYSIGFKKTVNGKQQVKIYSLGTKRALIAQKLKRRIEAAYEVGEINPFHNFDLRQWLDNKGKEENNAPSTLQDAAKQFIVGRSHIRETTTEIYKDILYRFSGEVGDTMPLNYITQEDISSFCFKKDLKPASKNSYLRAVKTFFNWLIENGMIDSNPAAKIKKIPENDNLADQIITEKQFEKILTIQEEHIKKSKDANTISTKAREQLWFKPLMATYFYSGIRAREALDMRWGDIDLEEDYMTVTGKGGKQRTVVIFKPLKPYLLEWQKKVPTGPENLVFPSAKSKTMEIKMTVRAVSKTFRGYREEAKLPKSIHLHSLRHSCATFMLRKGFGLMEVHNMLGHQNLDVTKRYTHLVPADIRERARKLKI